MAGVLVKIREDGQTFRVAAERSFGARAVSIETILDVPPRAGDARSGLAPSGRSTWMRVDLGMAQAATPWEQAHALLTPGQPFAAAGVTGVEAVEPDLEQTWLPPPSQMAASEQAFCTFDDQDGSGGKAIGESGVAWHLGGPYSELANAGAQVGGKLADIVIAHLDTGYDAKHVTLPANLSRDLQRSFVAGDDPLSAADQTPPGMTFMRNRGHGTGTLSLLAGNKLDGTSAHWPGFVGYVGGAPLAKIVPVRIADWVIRFTTGSMVQGFGHARQIGAHVLSMSMGGIASRALADAVNLAYEAGVVMVTAAGNNVAWTPMPKSIVFPARFRRVLAACGVMADGRAYAGLEAGTMQGSYGPLSKMHTALGGYTPNVPWAQIDCGKIVDMDGGGTSAATPQIAAAAALWLAEHWEVVRQYPQPWMRVEAVRHALFSSAHKTTAAMGTEETFEKIGQGVLKAHAALALQPPAKEQLVQQPPVSAS